MMFISHKSKLFFMSVWVSLLTACSTNSEQLVQSSFDFADKQLRILLEESDKVRLAEGKTPVEKPCPRNIEPDGSLRMIAARDWCSGFFPGILWYMYEYTKAPFWETNAKTYTEYLEPLRFYKGTHDLGFMLYCSYGNGFRLTQSDAYKAVLIDGAESLCTRYDSIIGCIKSWDHNKDKWQFPVIIDNMMNLEFLFEVSKITGNNKYKQIAISHANTTMKNHFRPDFSSYHVIDYDTITGAVRNKHTHQGYAHESAWARGQAWGLYGFTMCYRETNDIHYLQQAEHIANFILNHPNLPTDLIPFLDFYAPNIPNEPRDASAAAIIASALYELSTYSPQNEELYREKADIILTNLSNSYRPSLGEMHGFLLHSSTGHWPHQSEINVPIIYADYYYLEALLRKQRLEQKGKLF